MAKDKFQVFVEDITTLEVNSMVVNSISGRIMPRETAAFVEIISAWVFQMEQLLQALNIRNYTDIEEIKLDIDNKTDEQRSFFDAVAKWNTQKSDFFEEFVEKESPIKNLSIRLAGNSLKCLLDYQAMGYLYKKIAKKIRIKSDKDYYTAELFRLLRTQTRVNCLLHMFANDQVAARDKYELRKLWELKGGFIYAQHSIQLDGDIISRINRKMLRDKQTKALTFDLLDFHRNNVEIAIKNWQFLVKTIVEVGKAIADGVIAFFKPV